MSLLLLIVILIFIFGGGGWYGYGRWYGQPGPAQPSPQGYPYGPYFGGVIGFIVLIAVLLILFGNGRF